MNTATTPIEVVIDNTIDGIPVSGDVVSLAAGETRTVAFPAGFDDQGVVVRVGDRVVSTFTSPQCDGVGATLTAGSCDTGVETTLIQLRNFTAEPVTVRIEVVLDGVPVGYEDVPLAAGDEHVTTKEGFGATYRVRIGDEVLAELAVEECVIPKPYLETTQDCVLGSTTLRVVNPAGIEQTVVVTAPWTEESPRTINLPAGQTVETVFGSAWEYTYLLSFGDEVIDQLTVVNCDPPSPYGAQLNMYCSPGIEQIYWLTNNGNESVDFHLQAFVDGASVYDQVVSVEPQSVRQHPMPFAGTMRIVASLGGVIVADQVSPGCDVTPIEISWACSDPGMLTVSAHNPRRHPAILDLARLTLTDGIGISVGFINLFPYGSSQKTIPWDHDAKLRVSQGYDVLIEEVVPACP